MKTLKERSGVAGVVERRLFDSVKLARVKDIIAKGKLNLSDVEILLNWAAKPQFADNWLWRIINRAFHLDLRIPFVTGCWTKTAIKHNLVTNAGLNVIAEQLGGTTTAPVTAVAIGIGTTAAAATDTALESEITTAGGERGAAVVFNQTTTETGDTERWIKTFSFTDEFAVTEEGLLDNNSTGGNLIARQVFSAINVVSGDSLQVTHSVQVSAS